MRTRLFGLILGVFLLGLVACQAPEGDGPTPTPPLSLPPDETPINDPTDPPTPSPQPNPSSGAVVISTVTLFEDVAGELAVVGVVQNQSGAALAGIQLALTFYGADDTLLLRVEGVPLHLDRLPANGESPFSYLVFERLDASRVEAEVTNFAADSGSQLPVEIRGLAMRLDDFGDAYCTGELVNPSELSAQVQAVSAQVLDGEGQLLGAAPAEAWLRVLAPGQAAPFRATVNVVPVGSQARQCAVVVDSRVFDDVPSQAEVALPINAGPVYRDALGGVHVLGEVINSSEATWQVQVLAGLYDSEGNVLDAMPYALPLPYLAGGQSHPVDVTFTSVASYSESLGSQIAAVVLLVDPLLSRVSSRPAPTALEVSADLFEQSGLSWTFSGQGVNVAERTLTNVVAFVQVRDASGQLRAYSASSTGERVLPGGEVRFTIFMWQPDGLQAGAIDYAIQVLGYED